MSFISSQIIMLNIAVIYYILHSVYPLVSTESSSTVQPGETTTEQYHIVQVISCSIDGSICPGNYSTCIAGKGSLSRRLTVLLSLRMTCIDFSYTSGFCFCADGSLQKESVECDADSFTLMKSCTDSQQCSSSR